MSKADVEPAGRSFDEEKASEYVSAGEEAHTCEVDAGEESAE